MKLLLDSHTIIWAVDNPSRVSSAAMSAMADPANDRCVSAATVWEIAIKVGLGKLTLSRPFRHWMEQALVDLRADILPITVDYADKQTTLPPYHRDPFDRMIIAQATIDGLSVVSADAQLDVYGVTRIW